MVKCMFYMCIAESKVQCKGCPWGWEKGVKEGEKGKGIHIYRERIECRERQRG